MELAQGLANNYVFRGVDRKIINGIAGAAEVKSFLPGDTLVRQFDYKGDLIVVLEGEAIVRGVSGEQLAELGPGSIAGEISLIDEQSRSATVVGVKPGKVAVINAEVIRGILEMDCEASSAILLNLCRVLCRRLRAMNVQVDSLGREAGSLR